MLISREVDYGVRIVLLLCESKTKMDAKEISEITNISIRFTLKILGKLASANLIKSFRGAKGGYMVDSNPSEISVYDILAALENDLKINACFSDKSTCSEDKISICGLRCKLDAINTKLQEELKKITMDTLDNCSGYDQN